MRAALAGNLCRCANYNRYVEAVVAAGAGRTRPLTARHAEARNEPAANPRGSSASTPLDDGRPSHAADRRRRARHRQSDVHAATSSCRACCTRACCAARIRTRASGRIDVSKARALPGVKAVLTHENCQVVWGAGSVAGGQQYNDEIKKITKQRRYAFNNPVRFVGEPVAAVAAVDRHVAEEALALIAVDYEVLPFVLDHEEALEARRAEDLARGQPLAEQPQRAAADRRRSAATSTPASATSAHVFEDRYSTAFVHNAQMEPRACVAHWDGDKLTVYTPTGGIANCRTTWRATSACPTRRSASSASTWAATSATRTRTRTPT